MKFNKKNNLLYDKNLLLTILSLSFIGFISIASSSMTYGEKLFNDPYYFIKHSTIYFFIAYILSYLTLKIPMKIWEQYSEIFFTISIIMLILVFFLKNKINGSSRWLSFRIFKIQPSEFIKLSLFLYLSKYIKKNNLVLNKDLWIFLKILFILITISILLLKQPDFGTVILLFLVVLFIFFLIGISYIKLICTLFFLLLCFSLLIFFKKYRINRIISFFNPWEHKFNEGYQIIQSLIAFGRGNIFGKGLGNSLQKLQYLPESHTDFIFSIIGEEFGYIGVLIIILLLYNIFLKAIYIGKKSLKINNKFSGFLSFFIGIWILIQSIINISVSFGIIPTKGITLPFISYGGSSFVIILISSFLLIRIDFETKINNIQAFKDNNE